MPPVVIAALYHFARLENYQDLRQPLLDVMQLHEIKGTLLLAHEGINGTVAGSRDSIDQLLQWLRNDPRLAQLVAKESYDESQPFYRCKVKLKKEIVTMGVEDIDPNEIVGTYVKAQDWNALISDPNVTVVDTRNNYEVQIGSFKHALNPETTTFREFPDYVKSNLNPEKNKKVAMFCTGGIRCEKSTAYLKQQGFEEVYHLEGGILKYLQEVPEQESLWQGECFVFDNRVTVNHQLEKGDYDQCHACRLPITEQDKSHEKYQLGVSCPHCFEMHSDSQKQRFAERQKQVQLAQQRGEDHIGTDSREKAAQRKAAKVEVKTRQRKLSETKAD